MLISWLTSLLLSHSEMRVYFYFFYCLSAAVDWAAIDRMGNYDVEYTKLRIRKWLVNFDNRLIEDKAQAKVVKTTMAKVDNIFF